MILKEAYRYQNFLDALVAKSLAKLSESNFITIQKESHNRTKVNPDAKDEIIDIKPSFSVEYTPNDVIDFVVKIIEEKQKITEAIVKAKRYTQIDIDSSIAMNKIKQECARTFSRMADKKPSEEETTGIDYKFDVNGEQKIYRYPKTVITSINYNRKDIKSLAKKYLSECDSISNILDKIEITTDVDFIPQFDVNSTFEDLITGE